MTYVVTLQDYTPAARFDGNPWTQATIGEAANSSGPFNVIDTVTLTPVDSDPTNPQERSFTTNNAALSSGWYQVIFSDAAGGQQVFTPVPYPPPADQAMPAYCSILDVQARSAARPVTASSVPNIAQVFGFIDDVTAEVNAILVKKGYQVPVVSASNPDAFATLHSVTTTGAWAMMEAAAPTSVNVDRAEKAWTAAKEMLSSTDFVLNAPMDVARSEPRGPWITTQPTGRVYDPMFRPVEGGCRGNPQDPYFSREQQF
jgi:hypothetical protein